MMTEDPGGQWMLEMGVNVALEMPAMLSGESFGLMMDLSGDEQEGNWPDGALPAETGGWQLVGSELCS
jgi:hypothetical protein